MKLFAIGSLAVLALMAVVADGAAAQGIVSPAPENEGQAYAATDTPMLQKWKLQMALALRDEATKLQVADGGTLSPGDRAYIQTRADLIRAQRTVPTY